MWWKLKEAGWGGGVGARGTMQGLMAQCRIVSNQLAYRGRVCLGAAALDKRVSA